MDNAASLAARIEAVFTDIHRQRMVDVPLLNPVLTVAAVGFRPLGEYYLGILITPWFMSLMLLPGEPDAWNELAPGSKRLHRLPSGMYEFIVGEEAGVGRYQTCSLFSPVFEFVDQASAVATAEAALTAIMDEANRDGTAEVGGRPQAPQKPAGKAAAPMTRRDLLRGAFLRGSE